MSNIKATHTTYLQIKFHVLNLRTKYVTIEKFEEVTINDSFINKSSFCS